MSKVRIKASEYCIFDKNSIEFSDFYDLNLAENDKSIESIYKKQKYSVAINSIVPGTVLEKTHDGLKLDIKYKSNGFVHAYEFKGGEYNSISSGDVIDVMVEELENKDGLILLSFEKAKTAKVWNSISKIFKENKSVEGVVTGKVKGGLYVDIGINAFLPGSQIDLHRVVDFDSWIGMKIQAYIVKLMPRRGNVIISRKKYVYEQKSEIRKSIIDNFVAGQIVNGIVKNITKYGAFIDIGGIDGLLHITDMTWSRIDDPTEIIQLGQTIPVKILSFDKETEKISLGMKQMTENPWDTLSDSVLTGSTVKGKIISIKDYGIFVEINRGIEGLVHISEVSWTDRINDLNKYFTLGQEIEAVVVSIERKNRRMSLSIKQLEKNPWETTLENYKIGQTIKGKVTNVADFGFFVQIAYGVDGLVHISDISWTQHIKHPSDLYKKEDIVEAVITDINKQKRKISLSIKALTENPWEKISKEISVGSSIMGTVVKITDFGAFIRLQNSEIEAFIHTSECSDIPNSDINDHLKVGETYKFRILRISVDEQKIGLSLREEKKQSYQQRQSYSDNKSSSNSNYSGSNYNSSKNDSQQSKAKNSLQLEIQRIIEEQKKKK
jgi:small subunit ribosomal protein S1